MEDGMPYCAFRLEKTCAAEALTGKSVGRLSFTRSPSGLREKADRNTSPLPAESGTILVLKVGSRRKAPRREQVTENPVSPA
jgi:hypothetical protein